MEKALFRSIYTVNTSPKLKFKIMINFILFNWNNQGIRSRTVL